MFKYLNGLFKSISLNPTISILKVKKRRIRKMAYDSRKLGTYGSAGFLVATLIIVAVQLTPMPKPFIPTEETGVLVLRITDAPPFTKPESLNITIDSIMIHRKGGGNETWVTFDLNENKTFDLVELENVTDLIGANELPVGNYTMIKMHVSNAIADFKEEKDVELKVPSDHIKIPIRFTIESDETTIILIDISYDSVAVSAHYNLRPVVKPLIEQQP